jgi:hypothetical protein
MDRPAEMAAGCWGSYAGGVLRALNCGSLCAHGCSPPFSRPSLPTIPLLPRSARIPPRQDRYLVIRPSNRRVFQCPAQTPPNRPPSLPTSSNLSLAPPSSRPSPSWPHRSSPASTARRPSGSLRPDYQHHRGRRLHAACGLAVMLPKTDEEAANLLALCLLLWAVINRMAVPALYFGGDALLSLLKAPGPGSYRVLVSPFVFAGGRFLR